VIDYIFGNLTEDKNYSPRKLR